MRAFLPVLCLLVATACFEDNQVGPPVSLNQRFTLQRGGTVPVEGSNLRIQFVSVTGDSRCPADAVCIQGGDAVVQIRVGEQNAQSNYDLHTGDTARASARHGDMTIELIELQPYPFSSRAIDPSDYRATLLVRR